MGDRNNLYVYVNDELKMGVYSHWGGSEIAGVVADVLPRARTNGDNSYGLKTVVAAVLEECCGGSDETGGGIWLDRPDDQDISNSPVHLYLTDAGFDRLVVAGEPFTVQEFVARFG